MFLLLLITIIFFKSNWKPILDNIFGLSEKHLKSVKVHFFIRQKVHRFESVVFNWILFFKIKKQNGFTLSIIFIFLFDLWLIPQGALAAQTENDEVDYTVELTNARKLQANFTQTLVASSASTSKNMKRCFQRNFKGQIISKGLFGILGFLPKTNPQIRF